MEISEIAVIEELNAEFYAAFEAGDLDRMAQVWAEDKDAGGSVVCVHPGGPMVRGRGAVLRSWALIMANTSYIQFVLTDVLTQISGDIAVLTCSENIITASDDGGGFAAGGNVATTNAFVRTDGGWRLWLHHGSPVMMRAEAEGE
ncbi:MAG TPA: nuclear transport factor 2 family protein [Streptosporangiaceae bacterium]|nr:nuclear transport factor 2 family protein [Streptosporangiaceae bacterium]